MAYPHSVYLSPDEFSTRFRAAWDAAKLRFFKVERRQTYNQAGYDAYEAFRRGNTKRAQELVCAGVLTQQAMYDDARARGVSLVRLRIFEEPLSDYLRLFEIPSYAASEQLGERICFARVNAEEDELPDCIIFDESVMFVNAYDGLNRLVGAIEVTDADIIATHLGLGERLLATSQSRADFIEDHNL